MGNEHAAKKFKVGEAVVLVDMGYHGDRRVYATCVTTVGRRWATIDERRYRHDRFDAVTGHMDAGDNNVSERRRILRPGAWDAEEAEREARQKLDAIGITVNARLAPKALTNKAVWEALRGLVEQS